MGHSPPTSHTSLLGAVIRRHRDERMTAVDIWWEILTKRLFEVRRALPRTLKGRIQLSSRSAGELKFFALKIDGPNSDAHREICEVPDVWVEVDEERLAKLLQDKGMVSDVFRVSGQRKLWDELFRALDAAPRSKSLLDLRASK